MTARISSFDRSLARNCLRCPLCTHARKKQKGLLFWVVRKVESSVCFQCRAYEKVYGRKSHEPLHPTRAYE